MVDIFKEVEEELRQERLKSLWDRYGFVVIGIGVAIVLVTAANVFLSAREEGQKHTRAELLAEALQAAGTGETETAVETLQTLSRQGPAELRALALINKATIHGDAGEIEEALAAYDRVAELDGVDPLYRDLARVKRAWTLEPDKTLAQLQSEIGDLLLSDSVWRHAARERLGFAAFSEERYEIAREHYQFLLVDAGSPQSTKERALEMLTVINDRAPETSVAPGESSPSGEEGGGS